MKPVPAIGRSNRLVGKRAAVSGIGSGIGQAIALAFAAHGALVTGADILTAAAEATARIAADRGTPLVGIVTADVTDPKAVSHFMTQAGGDDGALDIVVNAAATAVFAPIATMRFADWRSTLAAELDSVFLCCQAAWPLLQKRGGSIVNFASANAYITLPGSAAIAHCAGKGGVLAMTRQLAAEGAPFGIRANTISPGMIATGATSPLLRNPSFAAEVMSHALLQRIGTPDDIAWCAIFLASDESAWVTAADFRIDGGATAL